MRTMLGCLSLALIGACAQVPPPERAAQLPPNTVPQIEREEAGGNPYRDAPARDEVLAFQQEGRKVAALVERDPAFGGFMFVNTPVPHAMVMFTGDAESRLRHYTRDPRFKARSVQWTLAQLESFKDQVGAQLSELDLRCYGVDGDEAHNTVTIGAPAEELRKVQAAMGSGAIRSPARIRLVEQGCAVTR